MFERKERRLNFFAVLFSFVIASTGAGQKPPDPVANVSGRWELRGRWNSEAVSTIIELISGGWYSQTLVASVNLRYEYNGADLVLIGLDAKGKPDMRTRAVLHV